MHYLQVVLNPDNKVILERALDSLMEEVTGKELVNVRTWELHCKRLCDW